MSKRTKLPNVVIEAIEIQEDNMEDMVTYSKKEEQNPFVQPEPKSVKEEPVLNYNFLTSKKLKQLCKERGYRNYSKLKKTDLICVLNGEQVKIPEKPIKKQSINVDIENQELIPKVEKVIEKKPIKRKKNEELKNNLVKEEVLIKDVEPEPEPKPEPKLPPKPKPKPKQPTQQPQPLPKQQPILPKQQPMLPKQKPKELYNPFTNYYNIT